MIAEFLAMRLDVELLKTAFGNSLKVGPVEVVDAESTAVEYSFRGRYDPGQHFDGVAAHHYRVQEPRSRSQPQMVCALVTHDQNC